MHLMAGSKGPQLFIAPTETNSILIQQISRWILVLQPIQNNFVPIVCGEKKQASPSLEYPSTRCTETLC